MLRPTRPIIDQLMLRNTARISLVLLVVLLSACVGSVFRQPEVSLRGVQLGGLGLRGGTLLVNVHVVNPNRFALNARQLEYDLSLGDPRRAGDTTWIDFASGLYDREFSVGAGDSTTVQIPVEFTYGGIGSAATSILQNGTFDYRARGAVDVRTPLGTRSVPFRKTGTVTLMGVR